MQKIYCPEKIERKIQKYWLDNQTFKVKENIKKEKYYCLSMLPYPSGRLHMGHVRNYTIGDVISRYHRMLGKNVLQPIGWDAFGLPAEIAAIKHKISPESWTYDNINYMRKQLKMLGFGYDWDREVTTCHPDYYRWEQWLFTRLYEKNLVYKKTSSVNWCPNDKTVLANEQLIENRCWRCSSKVEQKKIPQWFIKITAYADQLLQDLDKLEDWPERVKTMQRNWIGKSKGVEIKLNIKSKNDTITVYTEYPEMLMGVTYITISSFHPLAIKEANSNQALKCFISSCQKRNASNIDNSIINNKKKEGIDTGLFAIHPFTQEDLPIWIIKEFLLDSDSDAIMAVPGHNQKDWEFANKYNLNIKPVLLLKNGNKPDIKLQASMYRGTLFNSKEFDGLKYKEAFSVVANAIISRGIGKYKYKYLLRDWGISRQRYWGAPIPMITLKDGTTIPIPKDQLPVTLPKNIFINGCSNPIKKDSFWAKIIYKGQLAFREIDTFDTFMESSWYYARYTDPRYDKGMLNSTAANYWLPVDQYIGGIEHATMHLIYFRFYHKLLRDEGLVTSDEPVIKLLCQGMVLADAFYYLGNTGDRIWVSPSDVNFKKNEKGQVIKATDRYGRNLVHAGLIKMSKSKNNGIDPQIMIDKYGADTVRLFIMFASPVEMELEWNESGVKGANRFLRRIWKIVYEYTLLGIATPLDVSKLTDIQKILRRNIHKTIIKVTDYIDRRQTFNTAISSIMELANILFRAPKNSESDRSLLHEALVAIVLMLYPFTPHISFYLWKSLNCKGDIDHANWPIADQSAIKEDLSLIIIQVNGKLRGKIVVPIGSDQSLVWKKVSQDKTIVKYLEGSAIRKLIYIPDKLLNLVTD